uniref:Uncharacterized protein n=1 Tax=Zea mays TaxID=4577 RepID=A0A804PRT0_MAIZE
MPPATARPTHPAAQPLLPQRPPHARLFTAHPADLRYRNAHPCTPAAAAKSKCRLPLPASSARTSRLPCLLSANAPRPPREPPRKPRERRPYLASECRDLADAERWRSEILREIGAKVAEIQNEGLGEHRLRDLNDEINKLLRERGHWERRIVELSGRDYSRSSNAPLITDLDSNIVDVPNPSGLLERPRALPRSTDPAVQIAGNFASVGKKAPVRSLPVSGCIPPFISGVYERNGANPCFEPSAGHHLFDGDRMVHAVRIHDGATKSYA